MTAASRRYRCLCGADFLASGHCSRCARTVALRPALPSLDERAAFFRRAKTTVADQVKLAPKSNAVRLFTGTLELVARIARKLRKARP